jgi:prepilin-type processing-associated H-X9-DG protein
MHNERVQRSTNASHAFTRLELLACLLGCGLVMAVILPSLANSTARSDRVLCFNNLRQMGVAYSNFGLEHDGLPPWQVYTSSGGNTNHPLKGNLYVQFSVLSNFLGSSKLLACPADTRRGHQPAIHWGTTVGGLWNPAYGDKSVSYFLGLEGLFRIPRAVLSGDRNLLGDPTPGDCFGGMRCFEVVPTTVEWTNDVHGLSGNLLFYDGSVEQTDTRRLREAFRDGAGLRDTNGFVKRTRLMMTFN